jgi:hypothetical protein
VESIAELWSDMPTQVVSQDSSSGRSGHSPSASREPFECFVWIGIGDWFLKCLLALIFGLPLICIDEDWFTFL